MKWFERIGIFSYILGLVFLGFFLFWEALFFAYVSVGFIFVGFVCLAVYEYWFESFGRRDEKK